MKTSGHRAEEEVDLRNLWRKNAGEGSHLISWAML